MSSLRLALKQSLQEASVGERRQGGSKRRNKKKQPLHRQQQRGRPRKSTNDDEGNDENDDDDEGEEEDYESEDHGEQEHDDAHDQGDEEGEDEEDDHHRQGDPGETEDRKQQRKLLKKQQRLEAAHKIQSEWKKKKSYKDTGDDNEQQQQQQQPHDNANDASKDEQSTSPAPLKKKRSPAQTVPPPEPHILEWSRSLKERKCRKHITKGLRVKVRFATIVKREGKRLKKRIWYGGRVSAVSKEGSKIRIEYDDGTTEVSKFPDKDVVVDDTHNGTHNGKHPGSAEWFQPPGMVVEPKAQSSEAPAVASTTATTKEQEGNAVEKDVSPPTENELQDLKPAAAEIVDAKPNDKTAAAAATTMTKPPTEAATPPRVATPPGPATSDKQNEENALPETDALLTPGPKLMTKPQRIPTDLGSPEDGELSPGITVTKSKSAAEEQENAAQTEPTEETTTSNPSLKQSSEEPVEPTEAPPPPPTAKETKQLSALEDTPEPAKRPSLTIRLSKSSKEGKKKEAPKVGGATDSEEEVFADTPVTVRKTKSIDTKSSSKKSSIKRKREEKKAAASSSTIGDEQPPTKRSRDDMDTNDDDVVAETLTVPAAAVEIPDLSMPDATEETTKMKSDDQPPKPVEGPSISSQPTTTTMATTTTTPEESAVNLKEDNVPAIKLTKRPTPAVVDEPSSPKPGRQSPTGRKTPDIVSHDADPVPDKRETEEEAKDVVLAPDAGEAEPQVEATKEEETLTHTSGTAVVGSENSAFSRNKPSKGIKQAASLQDVASFDEGPADANPPLSKEGSLPSSESLPRSGRRAAQQAMEKINTKPDPSATPDPNKKKKKRRREDGAEESDESVDDRQWVQCESCGKWRILPRHVKVSSLPKHWYCHLNTYDPKRNNCAAPELTAKQAAKEWRRARKRAKKQKLEQDQLVGGQQEKSREATRSPVNSPKPPKAIKKTASTEEFPHSASGGEETVPLVEEDSGHDKKGRKGQGKDAAPEEAVAAEPKKPGRKRGRPARNSTPVREKEDGDNVEWVQCEKCEKWRKLPHHITADELPDIWYCSMNTWNPNSASCESPEDKADAHHQEVGANVGQFLNGAAGKYSYRAMIFGTGKKHNRPTSERTRAAESLYQRQFENEDDGPQTSVMYAKSSRFLPRTSNFNKSNQSEEDSPGLFDILSNSEVFSQLRSLPMDVKSSASTTSTGGTFPKFQSFENLPTRLKEVLQEVVLQTLGSGTLTGDEVILEAQRYPLESLSSDYYGGIRDYFHADIMINTLLALVRDGRVEMTCLRDCSVPMTQWVPRYRKARTKRALEMEEAARASRCMKLAKPWKQRAETGNRTEWISGSAAFS